MLNARQWCKGVADRKLVNCNRQKYGMTLGSMVFFLTDLCGCNSMNIIGDNHKNVSALLSNNTWNNHMDGMRSQMQYSIKNISIQKNKQTDFWHWIPNKDGKFNIISAWNHIRPKYIKFNWAKVIWDNKCAPKMSICTLLAKLNRPHTKDKLSKWNTDIDKYCTLCTNQIEDRDHLFFNCTYSRTLFGDIMNKLHLIFGNSVDFNHVFDNQCTKQTSNMLLN